MHSVCWLGALPISVRAPREMLTSGLSVIG
jgi:hypothetical protein